MSYRVIQWSTGNVGAFSLRAAIQHPEIELVGIWVHSEKKAGSDAGELCGLPACGIIASCNSEELLSVDADAVIYTATADLRPLEAIEDICDILRSGKNVVSSSLVSLVDPHNPIADWSKRLEAACKIGHSSFFTSGIDPGFANDILPLTLSGLCERWEKIRIREIVNYATYNQPEVVLGTMGFGKPMEETPLLLMPGMLTMAWGGTIRLLAKGLEIQLDEIRQQFECIPAPKSFKTPMGTIEKGTRAALRFEVQGIVSGEPRLIVEHVTRMDDSLCPEWPQSDGGYQVIIEGIPKIECSLDMADEKGDHAVGGVLLTATRLVNSIPAVCDAKPGLLSALDLPLVTGKGLMSANTSTEQ